MRSFRAPTAVTPAVGCTLGSPKSGFLAGFVAISARMPSNCPRRMVSRFCRSAAVAAEPGNHSRSEEHTSELQSLAYLVCRLLLEKKKKQLSTHPRHID